MADLRTAGLHIGVDDFVEAQEALQYGLAGETADELRNLLRMLWLTSVEDFPLFDQRFDLFLEQARQSESRKRSGLESALLDSGDSRSRGLETVAGSEKGAPAEPAPPPKPVEASSEHVQEEAAIRLQEGKDKSGVPLFQLVRQHDPVRALDLRREWQRLKVQGKIHSRMELDLKPTIREIARKGYFDGPVLKPRTLRSLNLVLLFDRGGSMSPMHDFCDRWKETLLRNVQVRQFAFAYFRNCPTNDLYTDPYLIESVPLRRFLNPFSPQQTVVILVTDGGAARQSWNTRRILRSQRLSRRLRKDGFHQLWLNPMAEQFWENNSARKIASIVPQMFCMDGPGTRKTVQYLNQNLRSLEV